MNTSTASNKPTIHMYKSIHALLKANGYKYNRDLTSALEHLEYTKEGCNDITVCGWHGTGKGNRYFGDVKMCNSLFINNKQVWEHDMVADYQDLYVYAEKLEQMFKLIETEVK